MDNIAALQAQQRTLQGEYAEALYEGDRFAIKEIESELAEVESAIQELEAERERYINVR